MNAGKIVCVNCGDFFDSSKLKKIRGKTYCKECIIELLSKQEGKKVMPPPSPSTQIVIQQQQQQSVSDSNLKPKGSILWLIFWIIVFFPIAILYFLIRRWD
jgi:hypothetical protein